MELNEQIVQEFVKTRQLIQLELVSGLKILGIILNCGSDWLVFQSLSYKSILDYSQIKTILLTTMLAEEELLDEN